MKINATGGVHPINLSYFCCNNNHFNHPNMIVIADSGSTKTDWCMGHTRADSRRMQTEGINPFHQPAGEIDRILSALPFARQEDAARVTNVYFYGAGCTPEKAGIVEEALSRRFPQARVFVESDLLGAARALCGTEPGIACILGTGSNSCAYDGERITAHVPPLGYILGDEGSGAVLGKRLAGDCLKHQLPDDLCQAFFDSCGLSPAEIIDKVYRQPLANRFLASLTPFLSAHRCRPEIQALLLSGFTDFFRRNVMQYIYKGIPVHFTGSIAHHFREEMMEAARRLDIRTGHILKSPMEGLMDYHFKP